MSSAFLLAAGFGTRLRPLTLHRPKPLVPVCGSPMLDYAVALLRRHGYDSAIVNAHWMPEAIERWAEASDFALQVSVEAPEILGTGGGLRAVEAHLDDPFVIVNGDILCDVDLSALAAAAPDGGAAMALRTRAPGERYGIVAGDAAGRVVDLVGLAGAPPEGDVDRTTHFTGVHAMTRSALERVPAEGFACVVRSAYVSLVPERRVAATRHEGVWLDVGNPWVYLQANLAVAVVAVSLALDPWERVGFGLRPGPEGLEAVGDRSAVEIHPSARLEGPVWIGAGAKIGAGARLGGRVIVGAGAAVGDGVVARDSVIWDGVAVPAETALICGVVHDGGVLTPQDPAAVVG